MTPPDSSTAHVPLVAHSSTATSTTATLSLSTAASATVGMPETVTFIAIPESHPHDQQRRQPLESIETLSTAPLLLGLGGYMAVSKAHRAIRKLLGSEPVRRDDPAPFFVDTLDGSDAESAP